MGTTPGRYVLGELWGTTRVNNLRKACVREHYEGLTRASSLSGFAHTGITLSACRHRQLGGTYACGQFEGLVHGDIMSGPACAVNLSEPVREDNSGGIARLSSSSEVSITDC